MNKRFALCLAATFGTGALSRFIMDDAAYGTHYKSLIQPSFAPPQWIYGIIWPLLYATMAVAAYLVWEKRKTITPTLAAYFCYLFLNPLWIYLYFVKHNLQLAAYLIVAIALLGWAFLYIFKQEEKKTFYWFFPYCLWISYAAALSVSYYLLNQ